MRRGDQRSWAACPAARPSWCSRRGCGDALVLVRQARRPGSDPRQGAQLAQARALAGDAAALVQALAAAPAAVVLERAHRRRRRLPALEAAPGPAVVPQHRRRRPLALVAVLAQERARAVGGATVARPAPARRSPPRQRVASRSLCDARRARSTARHCHHLCCGRLAGVALASLLSWEGQGSSGN